MTLIDDDQTIIKAGLSIEPAADDALAEQTLIVPTPGRNAGGASIQAALTKRIEATLKQASNSKKRPTLDVLDYYADDLLGHDLNSILTAANTLITLMVKIRQSIQHKQIGSLHKHLIQQIRGFESRCKATGVPAEKLVAARYVLCASLDDAVLNTPWGVESGWAQKPLLSVFHRETNGGEKVFLVLNRLMELPKQNLDLLELYYICIKMGFEGKYRLLPRGSMQLGHLLEELSLLIERYSGDLPTDLSPNWKGAVQADQAFVRYTPFWAIALLVFSFLLLALTGIGWWAKQNSDETIVQVNELLEPIDEKPR